MAVTMLFYRNAIALPPVPKEKWNIYPTHIVYLKGEVTGDGSGGAVAGTGYVTDNDHPDCYVVLKELFGKSGVGDGGDLQIYKYLATWQEDVTWSADTSYWFATYLLASDLAATRRFQTQVEYVPSAIEMTELNSRLPLYLGKTKSGGSGKGGIQFYCTSNVNTSVYRMYAKLLLYREMPLISRVPII